MCNNLPLNDPTRITVPVMITRGQYDGIAGFDDLVEFFKRLPNPEKHFAMLPGSAHSSLHEKNYRTVYRILHSFFTQPAPAYVGPGHDAWCGHRADATIRVAGNMLTGPRVLEETAAAFVTSPPCRSRCA